MNQDRTRAVTLEDLIRRYDLENLKAERKVIKTMATTIENQHTIIKQFVKNTSKYTKDQAKLTAWFFSGVPSLENEPFLSLSEEEKQNVEHLYYDRETGLVYHLENDGEYKWTVIDDDSLAQSMAIANSDPDSQDNKRNIFYEQPTPPYAVGDIWIDNNTIMRCRCSRDGDEFKDTEWVEQKNYSESNVLLDVRAVIDSFIENVEKNYVTTSKLETTKSSIEATVEAKLDGVSDEEGFVTVASLILAINGAESTAKIKADKIALSATDILNLIAGNEINLTSRNITIKSDNFSVTKDGIVTANKLKATNAELSGEIQSGSGNIGGWHIDDHSLSCDIVIPSYSVSDRDRLQQILQGSISPTAADYSKLDANKDGRLDIRDLLIIQKYIVTGMTGGTGKLLFDTSDHSYPIKVLNGKSEVIASFGPWGSSAKTQPDYMPLDYIDAGNCQLNAYEDKVVYFNKTFQTPPKVFLQCIETGTANAYVGHVVEVTNTYFKAYLAFANEANYKNFFWMAIEN